MKKLLSPLLYAAFLFPLTGVAVAVEFFSRSFGLLPKYSGVIETELVLLILGSILIVGVPIFWLVNSLLAWVEKPTHPKINDHLRQSFFFYFMILFSLGTWIIRGFNGSEEDGYLLIWSAYSLVAITINFFYLFKPHKP